VTVSSVCRLDYLRKDKSFVPRRPALLAPSTVLDRTPSVSRRVIGPLSLALNVFIDTRHPAIDFVDQTAFAALIHMLRPCIDCLLRWFDSRVVIVLTVLEQVLDDLHCVFDTSRGIAKGLMGAERHEHVGHRRYSDAEEGMRLVVRPNSSLAVLTVATGDKGTIALAVPFDCVESAGNCIEASGVDQNVQPVLLAVRGLDAVCHDAGDGSLLQVDEIDVGLIVRLEVAALKRYSLCSKPMVLGDETVRRLRIVHSLTNLLSHIL
jgi:hypothetical protein